MQLVAPRAGDDGGGGAAGAAKFGRRALRQDAELRDRFHRQPQRKAAVHAVHVLRAVNEVDVLFGPHAVDGIGLSLTEAATSRGHPRGQRRDARFQQPELREIASVERQVNQLAPGDHAPEHIGGRIDQLRPAGDRHRVGQRTHRQLRVDPHRLADVDLNRFEHLRGELRRLDGQAVAADGQQQQPVEAVAGRCGLLREAGIEIARGDARTDDDRAARVAGDAFDDAGGVLSEYTGGCERTEEQCSTNVLHRPVSYEWSGEIPGDAVTVDAVYPCSAMSAARWR